MFFMFFEGRSLEIFHNKTAHIDVVFCVFLLCSVLIFHFYPPYKLNRYRKT